MSIAEAPWTEASLVNTLRSRYASNEWALVTQVRDGAGWDRRTFDALAIGLWASRGHPVHGFECKVSKSDWKRELAKPEKADPLVAFCHHWWIVAPRGVVDPMTLPVGWGLLEAHENGTIHTVVESPRREAQPVTAGFVAQIAKRLIAERPAQAEIDAADAAGYERGKAASVRAAYSEAERAQYRLRSLQERVDTFEEASGLTLDIASAYRVRERADAIRTVIAMGEGWQSPLKRLEIARRQAADFIESVDVAFPEIASEAIP